MADQNRRKQLASLLAAFQSPGHALPIPELAEYLRLVRGVSYALHSHDADVPHILQYSPLQLRDLRIRDSDNVVTYGGHNLQQLAAALPEEECKSVVRNCAHS